MFPAFISLSALKGAVISLTQWLARILFAILVSCALIALIWPLLPNDPFRPTISSFAEAISPYVPWIKLFIPVDFIGLTMGFYAAYRYAFWVYRRLGGLLIDDNGQLNFDI